MNRIFCELLCTFFICIVFFTSCEKYPIDALLGLNGSIGAWPDTWYLYDDQFNTKGNPSPVVWEGCDSGNNVDLNLNCTDRPQSGTKCIRFTWIGNSNNSGKTDYFGFGMRSRDEMGGTIDLTNSGYKYLKFYVRGNLNKNCIFKVEIPKSYFIRTLSSSEITSDWQEFYIDLQDNLGRGKLNDLEYVIGLTLQAVDGVTNGGELYIDNIRFTKD